MQGIANRYQSLKIFLRDYFCGWPKDGPLGLEEVWSAVDLNQKHIHLRTHEWEAQTREYSERYSAVRDYEYFDDQDVNEGEIQLDNPRGCTKFKFLADCARHLHDLVYRAYGKPTLKKGEEDRYATLHKFLDGEGVAVEYITFNYDLILEKGLEEKGFDFAYLADVTDATPLVFSKDYCYILKLHGSLSWKHSLSDSVRPLTVPRIESHSKHEVIEPVKPDYSKRVNVEPAIIPPTWAKQDINDDVHAAKSRLSQLILHQWRTAIEVIGQADAVLMIGYSFPGADLHARRLFQVAMMRRKSQLRVLWVTSEKEAGNGRGELAEKPPFRYLRRGKIKMLDPIGGFSKLCERETFKSCFSQLFP